MLSLSYGSDCITYTSGIAVPASFTRYSNQHWDRTASDLLRGIADVYEDAGLIAIGDEWEVDLNQVLAASPLKLAEPVVAQIDSKQQA